MTNKSSKLPFRKSSFFSRIQDGLLNLGEKYHTWCIGLLFFNESVEREELIELVKKKLLISPRFRSRYDLKRSGFQELDQESIDLEYHVKYIEETASLDDLYFHVSYPFELDEDSDEKLPTQQFGKADISKPLWQIRYFKNIEDGRSCLLVCISHIIGDGVSQVEIIYTLMDKLDDSQNQVDDKKTTKISKKAPQNSYGPLNKARIFVGGAFSALLSILSRQDTPSSLTVNNPKKQSKVKSVYFTPQISVKKIKEIKSKFPGATVNDVLVGLLNHCVIEYLKEVEELADKNQLPKNVNPKNAKFYSKIQKGDSLKLSASFPFNMRSAQEMGILKDGSPNNNITLAILKYENFTELIYKVKKKIDAVKLSPSPIVQAKAGKFANAVMSRKANANLLVDFQTQSTVMLSNVAGPQQVVSIAGRELQDLQFGWYGYTGIYLGLISYAGKATCCVCANSDVVDARELGKFWEKGFADMYEECSKFDGEAPQPAGLISFYEKL
eukprot:snap_masked-scaffold_15-processed-gene-3.12-mRNA-1 protein AED:1.00 eAED:1.00 QI:0/0/0/0/1/1/2/0/497